MDGASPDRSVISRYDGVVFDLDGVIYVSGAEGIQALPGATKTVAAARDAGVAVVFMTNNASRSAQDVADELAKLGVPARPDEIVTSGQAAGELVDAGTRCLVVGSAALRAVVADRGCVLVDDPAVAQVVLVGFTRELVWDDLRRATLALAAGARFLATNRDAAFPSAEGLWPGNGAVLAALTTASGVEPEIAGKPGAAMFDVAVAKLGEGVERILMVGDRAETDIAGAQAVGWDAALVLTGVTGREQAMALRPPPTYVVERVDDLLA